MEHKIGRKIMGGFPGHEHYHPTGEQLCLSCGKTLKEIIENKITECNEKILKELNIKVKDN